MGQTYEQQPHFDEWPIRAQIFKLLKSPGIDSKESILPAYVAWRDGTINHFLLGS
jgi:hypothetical protein